MLAKIMINKEKIFLEYDENDDIGNKVETSNTLSTKTNITDKKMLIFQVLTCLVALISVLILKYLNYSLYEDVKSWYNETLHSYVIDVKELKKMPIGKYKYFNKKDTFLADVPPVLLSVPVSRPLKSGNITSRFGKRKDPFTFKEKMHSGLDIGAVNGEAIHAILPGVVAKAEKMGAYGNCVVLNHGNCIQSLYAHCEKVLVKEGNEVNRGQDLALVGHSGRATGNHLHLEILINDVKQDPEKFLENANV